MTAGAHIADQVAGHVSAARSFFRTGKTLPLQYRVAQLDALGRAIESREGEILAALQEDLHKCEFEGYTSEVGFLYEEIRFARRHLRRWMKPRRVPTPLVHAPGRSTIHHRPLGVSAILAPWNYPFQLAVAPLVGAIAAGNCAIVKPSEVAPATAEVVERLLRETFPQDYIAVVTGGPEYAEALTGAPVDHIFFTGSTAVGRRVMRQAAERLVPVTLELGGKSPAIVTAGAKIPVAARRIAWGKWLNAGQTCVAPDYLCVHESVHHALIEEIRKTIGEWFGSAVETSREYGHIINGHHFQRLTTLLERQRTTGAPVEMVGGEADAHQLLIPPVLCRDVLWDHPVMEDEIFGPILPVLVYRDLPELLERIADRPSPLAAYLFSERRSEQELFVRNLPFGGATINDTIIHLANGHLPFGGVGPSGMGSYHGEAGFQAFSHQYSVLRRGTFPDPPLKYPPYGTRVKLIRRIMHR